MYLLYCLRFTSSNIVFTIRVSSVYSGNYRICSIYFEVCKLYRIQGLFVFEILIRFGFGSMSLFLQFAVTTVKVLPDR